MLLRFISFAAHHGDDAVEEDNAENLKRIYDMRTWDMYLRITEARKRSSYQESSSHTIPHHHPGYMASPHQHLQQSQGGLYPGEMEDEAGDHQLFFGDMD